MESEDMRLQVEKIITSKSFGNSTTYANLLRFLTRSTANNDVPKETTIAAEIFGKKDFDPSQSTLVRVYVYNLRKKLMKFYQNEGKQEKYCLTIPKGSYAVQLIKKESNSSERAPYFKTIFLLISGLLLASLLLNLYFSNSQKKKPIVNTNGLWKDLVETERPKMLVIGDLFVFSEKDTLTGISRTIRGPAINSLEDFGKFRTSKIDAQVEIEPLNYSHLILGSTHWIKKLSEIFYSIDDNYTIRTMSRFNPKQLQDYDLLVVGMHKTLGVFKNFYANSAISYHTEKDAFYFHNQSDTIVYQPNGDADTYHTDYALMAKVPGPNANSIYIFSGIWDTGATQSFKNFTDQNLLGEIEEKMKAKYGALPKYYEIFFKVNGIDRMELSSEILHMKVL